MKSDDTIVAISSAVGAATRMIVRASGPLVRLLFERLTGSGEFPASSAGFRAIDFNRIRLRAWVYTFESPHSATGEDLVEFHIPGNPLLARMLLEEIVRLGSRQAEAGEFSARSYFNGKIDLTEAEGIAAAIAAQNERELRAARQLMAGELAQRLRPVLDSLADTLALIEAGIDFTDQDISFIAPDQLRDRVESAGRALAELLRTSTQLERLSHEPRVVLAGRPNAGKSTLLNALAGKERAVVSPVAGTTRDILWAPVHLCRGIVRLIDVAGLESTLAEGPIDAAMQSQARRAIEEADCLLLIRDSTDPNPAVDFSREPDLVIYSKSDLRPSDNADALSVSAKTGAGMPELIDRLDRIIFGTLSADAALALNARHISLIEQAAQSLDRAATLIPDGGLELIAVELREALDLLGAVLGSVTPDDVLGRVFSRFCVGK